MKKLINPLQGLKKHWLCKACGFRIAAAPAEEEPRHCPRCYKKNNRVSELEKIPASM